jgi:acyl carrier protein
MNKEAVIEKVKAAISNSCGIEIESIKPESTLFDDLTITSIDMVDILYMLETEFNVSLKISDIETESRGELNGAPFEIDNVITAEGLDAIKRKVPEIPEEKLKVGLTIHEIANLITVEILANMVLFKIQQQEIAEK